MLPQFGLTEKDIAGAVTCAGTSVKSTLGKACEWEWSISHLLDRVIVDSMGMALAKNDSKNVRMFSETMQRLVMLMTGVLDS